MTLDIESKPPVEIHVRFRRRLEPHFDGVTITGVEKRLQCLSGEPAALHRSARTNRPQIQMPLLRAKRFDLNTRRLRRTMPAALELSDLYWDGGVDVPD